MLQCPPTTAQPKPQYLMGREQKPIVLSYKAIILLLLLSLRMSYVQATSYLVTAWEALASQAGKNMADLPVTWSDVSIYQAVQAEAQDSVTLSVLLDRSDRFQAFSFNSCIHSDLPWYLAVQVKRSYLMIYLQVQLRQILASLLLH